MRCKNWFIGLPVVVLVGGVTYLRYPTVVRGYYKPEIRDEMVPISEESRDVQDEVIDILNPFNRRVSKDQRFEVPDEIPNP